MKSLKESIFSLCLLLIVAGSALHLSADVDPFYSKIFKEGKIYFDTGNFREAELNFKIAEFGLLDEQEIIKEIYIYYSLTLFQLEKFDEAQQLLKRLETEFKVKNLNSLAIPQPIKIPVKAMLNTLSLPRREGEPDYRRKIFRSELLFLSAKEQLELNKFAVAQKNIEKLEQLNKNDPQLSYLKGILSFKRQDYKDCVHALKDFEKQASTSTDPLLLDKLYFHLSLSYHYLKNENQTAVYYNKIKDLDIKSDLYRILTKKSRNQGAK